MNCTSLLKGVACGLWLEVDEKRGGEGVDDVKEWNDGVGGWRGGGGLQAQTAVLTHASRRAPLEHKHGIIPQHAPLPSLFVCSSINTRLLVCRFPVGVLQERRRRRQRGADDTFVFQTRVLFWGDGETKKRANSCAHLIWKPTWHRQVKTRSTHQCSAKSFRIWTALFVSFSAIRDLRVSIRKAPAGGRLQFYSYWKKQINSSTFSTMRSY